MYYSTAVGHLIGNGVNKKKIYIISLLFKRKKTTISIHSIVREL